MRFRQLLLRPNICLPQIIPNRLSPFPRCHIIRPTCDLRLVSHARDEKSSLTYNLAFEKLLPACLDYTTVHTDGSFAQGPTDITFMFDGDSLPIAFTVLTAILLPNCVPCTELSYLFGASGGSFVSSARTPKVPCSPNGYSPDHSSHRYYVPGFPYLYSGGKSVVFCWAPGRRDLPRNEAADVTSKAAALHGPLVSDRALGTEVSAFFRHALLFL